jgi:hypothetical protein
VVNDVRGEPVQQMRVVDADQAPAVAARTDERVDDATHAGRGRRDGRHRLAR